MGVVYKVCCPQKKVQGTQKNYGVAGKGWVARKGERSLEVGVVGLDMGLVGVELGVAGWSWVLTGWSW